MGAKVNVCGILSRERGLGMTIYEGLIAKPQTTPFKLETILLDKGAHNILDNFLHFIILG